GPAVRSSRRSVAVRWNGYPMVSRRLVIGSGRHPVRCRRMFGRLTAMPSGIRFFLFYAFLILAGIGLSLRFVVDQAIAAPVSLLGVIVMILLAYTIFTTTLVLQRKQAARGLAIGLASLTIPLVPLLLL